MCSHRNKDELRYPGDGALTVGHDVRAAMSRHVPARAGRRLVGGYAAGMKTAISLPDRLFDAAERQARRTNKSRSQLYAEAIAEYLDRHAPDEVTDAMNQVAESTATHLDGFGKIAAARALKRSEW